MNYKQIYFNLIKKALQRESVDGYYETHHIIPRCLGGTDDKNNLVKLTAREHFVAHYLLVKIRPDNFKLINAAIMMSCTNKTRTTSRTYEWMRRKFAAGRSKQMKDPNHNASFGTCWVHHVNLQQTKRINKNELQKFIEQGWKKGRVINFARCKVCENCGKEYLVKNCSRVKVQRYCGKKCSDATKGERYKPNSKIYQTIQKNKDQVIEWRKSGLSLDDIIINLNLYHMSAGGYYKKLKTFLAEHNLK